MVAYLPYRCKLLIFRLVGYHRPWLKKVCMLHIAGYNNKYDQSHVKNDSLFTSRFISGLNILEQRFPNILTHFWPLIAIWLSWRAVQTLYWFGKSTSLDLEKIFRLGLGFPVDDVTMRAYFRLFGQVYLPLGANPTGHFMAQVFFWKLGCDPRP